MKPPGKILVVGGGIAGMSAAIELRKRGMHVALQAFTARRFERRRMVVENSPRLGELERDNVPKEVHQQLMRESMTALTAPI